MPPVSAHLPCTVIVMSAVPVQAAGRSRPDPASTTGVVVGPVLPETPPDADGPADDPASGLADGTAVPPDESPDEGAGDSDEPPADDGL